MHGMHACLHHWATMGRVQVVLGATRVSAQAGGCGSSRDQVIAVIPAGGERAVAAGGAARRRRTTGCMAKL